MSQIFQKANKQNTLGSFLESGNFHEGSKIMLFSTKCSYWDRFAFTHLKTITFTWVYMPETHHVKIFDMVLTYSSLSYTWDHVTQFDK